MGGDCRSNYQETGIDCSLEEDGWLPNIKNKKSFNFSVLNTYTVYVNNRKKADKDFVTKEQYLKFLNEYFAAVFHRIVEDGFILILPYYMGRFYLQKSRRVGFVPDETKGTWNKSKRTMNLHSFRKYYNVKWDKSLGYFKNRNLWKYKSAVHTRSKLSKFILSYNKPVIDKPLIGHNFKETKWN
jgi:hypothetical protein